MIIVLGEKTFNFFIFSMEKNNFVFKLDDGDFSIFELSPPLGIWSFRQNLKCSQIMRASVRKWMEMSKEIILCNRFFQNYYSFSKQQKNKKSNFIKSFLNEDTCNLS